MTYFPEQPLKVIDDDRLVNKIPVVDESIKTTLNANRVMNIVDKIISGGYRFSDHVWSYTSVSPNERPSLTSVPVVKIGERGFNTDFNGLEHYTGATYGWYVTCGVWDTAHRPHETTTGANDLAPGSSGYNVEAETWEYWDGSQWRAA